MSEGRAVKDELVRAQIDITNRMTAAITRIVRANSGQIQIQIQIQIRGTNSGDTIL
jgi:hypothetical protein